MEKGYIKSYRKLLDDSVWRISPQQKVVFWTLLMMANYKENEWIWKGEKFTCKPGQLITSLDTIVKMSGPGISIRNVRTALENLEKLKVLTNESTKTGRLITICNWDKYQGFDTLRRQTNRQRGDKEMTTNKNDNNKIKEIYKKFLGESKDKSYHDFVEYLLGNNQLKRPFEKCLSMTDPISYKNYQTLMGKYSRELIQEKIEAMENWKPLLKDNTSFYLTLNNWCRMESKKR
jgi:hypothetical protein